ncbi:unnamed protein product [Polarella glacialis]|uniref:ribonuclease H n=1 Tax=Polarella glacialis TaxID=89957 RepID=A0A813DMG5_POLGL|nr:unnamed protein product [Polarella glacialis]
MELPWIIDQRKALHTMQLLLPTQPKQHCHNNFVYTDGPCSDQARPEIRRAGCGIYFEEQFPGMSFPLPGQDQSAPRSELWAAIVAIHVTTGSLTLCIDCKYVVQALLALLAHPDIDVAHWDNSDLWHIMRAVINDHDGDIIVRKVKGHAKTSQCQGNPELTRDKQGNDKADKLAVDAVHMHTLSADMRREFYKQA